MNSNIQLSYLGQWQYGNLSTGVVSFYSPIVLGSHKLTGIVLGGWDYSGWNNTTLHTINIAILDQNPDGTLSLNTSKYIADASTNGEGSVIVADLNGDGRPDIFLAAHNESPLVPTASTVYLSQSDGSFKKITLADSIEAHSAILSSLNGIQTVVTAGYGPTDPFYQYNASTGNFTVSNWGNTYSGSLYGSSALTGDFLGDGKSELVIGDFKTGPGYAFNPNGPTKLAIYQLNGKNLASAPAFIAPLYFDQARYQNQGFTSLNSGLSHNYRVWEDDFNHDGKSDLLLGVGIWSASAGMQKAKLQMLQNQGNLQFTDVTDQLDQAYNENSSFVDYSMQMVDLDHSGINSYLMAGDPSATGSKQSNYLMLNDGTGKLYAALHDQFAQWAGGLALKFIAYQLADGSINYVAQTANGALYNLPVHYNPTTDSTQNIAITDRNQSMLMRTWAGNDTIYDTNANASAAHIDGGLGLNTSVYSDKAANYTVSAITSGGFEIKHTVTNAAPKVDDTLVNVQRLQFTDTNVALDIAPTQTAGSVYMLYQATFNRTPDAGGLGYWIAQVDKGANIITNVASAFVASPEFVAKYGSNPTNASYVDNLYQNVLHRAGDAGGIAYWNQQLNSGAVTKAYVLEQFATLPEGAANVAPTIAHGIAYTQWVG